MKNTPPAQGLCENCLKNNIQSNSIFATCYCAHNNSGGLLDEATGLWSLWTPLTKKGFEARVEEIMSGVRLFLGAKRIDN